MTDDTLSKLDAREETFCMHILAGKSQTAAYKLAYQPKRAKPKTIHEKASRLMAQGKVRARLAELWAPVIAQAQMSRTEWLERLTKCCRFDLRKMFDAQGRPKKITELDESEAAAIAALEVSEKLQGQDQTQKLKRTYKLKFMDRLNALALMGKACHWYADRLELTGRDGRPLPPLTGITVEFVEASPKR
jgi:phage terminase small subunit